MTAVRCVDLQCDECEELYGVGFFENAKDVRAAARADGWINVGGTRVSATGKIRAGAYHDVCPECRSVKALGVIPDGS